MLSQTVEYALRAVCHLAVTVTSSKSNGDANNRTPSFEPQTTEQIASTTLVPKAYLSKVMQQLSRGGIVQSHRGVRGGFSLAKSPESLTILEVVNAVEPLQRINTCPLGLAAHGKVLCPLHHRLDQAMAAMEEAFRNTYLSEVLAEPGRSIPFVDAPACHFPTTNAVKNASNDGDQLDEAGQRIVRFDANTDAFSPTNREASVTPLAADRDDSARLFGSETASPAMADGHGESQRTSGSPMGIDSHRLSDSPPQG